MKYITESAVIVVSILLAFAVDAWWEERTERQLEQELLLKILENSRVTQAMISVSNERADINYKNLVFFFNATTTELSSIPKESFQDLFTSFWQPNTISVLPLLQTADISILKDAPVLDMLTKWIGTAEELISFNQLTESYTEKVLLVMGRHPIIQQYLINGPESIEDQVDFTALRNDEEFMAILAAKRLTQFVDRRVILISLQDTSSKLEQLIIPLIE